MNLVTAINKKHQSAVNRAVKALVRYNVLNDLRDKASDSEGEDSREFNMRDRQCAAAYDKYLDIIDLLPKREVTKLENQIFECC